MKDTVKSLLESNIMPALDVHTRNTLAYNRLTKVEEAVECTKYNAAKVIVNRGTTGYLVEFTGNVERLMRDQELEVDEAMELIASTNDIPVEECVLIFDEAAIDIIDIDAVQNLNPKFALGSK